MKRNVLIVANPYSGPKKSIETVIGFKEYLDAQDIPYDFYYTSKQRNAQKTVQHFIKDDHSDLVILGGDGTINEAVNGIGDKDIPISIIPTGTGNDFCKMLDLGKKLKDKFETAAHANPKSVDAGLCNDRIFMNGVGIGFDGEIVVEMMNNSTMLTGQAAYYYHVVRILSTYKEKEFNYQIDGEPFYKKLILLTIANGTTFGGGFKLTPDAKIDDGFLNVCQIERLSPAKRYLNVLRLQNGTHNALKAVTFYESKEVKIDESPILNAHIDGEYLGKPPFNISVLPGRFRIRTN